MSKKYTVSDMPGSKVFMRKALFRIFVIAIALVLILLLLLFGIMTFSSKRGFSVSLNDENSSDVLFSLSENGDFSDASSRISCEVPEKITNISGFSIPDDVNAGKGAHNGENYVAYSFYLKNVSRTDAKLNEKVLIESVIKNVDDAIRIRLYRDGTPTTYAKVSADGTTPEIGTVPFADERIAVDEIVDNLAAGQVIKYTVVIWVEGDDPECLDDIRGGNMKLSMTFSALDSGEETQS